MGDDKNLIFIEALNKSRFKSFLSFPVGTASPSLLLIDKKSYKYAGQVKLAVSFLNQNENSVYGYN
jgi:hypothetical protein